MTREHRGERRLETNEPARLIWADPSGAQKWARGRCVSISRSGCQVEMAESLPARTTVMFELPNRDARGSAVVRYAKSFKSKFRVGLEFAWGEKLKFDLPADGETGA